ncbi:MAG TPA: NAD(P)/FAD-dependent oxidoreductase [Candidatus Thermoplasmatota archaeon]|nr:NAD(P)/FAD-dependent oxidoreductase [Candidatus Thermoplasmatota archaeon]
MSVPRPPLLVVLGGGAAGFFGALRAAELAPQARVVLLEATGQPLQKVRISGGGRCNVTHHPFDPALALQKYPRGAKELRGVLSRFGSPQTMAWFEAQGVALKVERDGRVFPTTDDSETICQALLRAAEARGVEVRTHATARALERTEAGLRATLKDGSALDAAAVLLATGSNPQGLALARSLGHAVVPGVPSLFTFHVKDARLEGLAGVSVEKVRARAATPDGETFEQEGPLLVTHWGLSAHAVLRLSAWGARSFAASGYKARLVVDFLPDVREDALRARCEALRREAARGTVGAHSAAPELPRRLWERLVAAAGGDPDIRWSDVPNRGIQMLLDQLKRAEFQVDGKGPFKEEFVTAGGVARREVDWRTMESRVCPGLFLAGEVLDVDALTGGFNLQNAWSTGWLAGEGMARRAADAQTP